MYLLFNNLCNNIKQFFKEKKITKLIVESKMVFVHSLRIVIIFVYWMVLNTL